MMEFEELYTIAKGALNPKQISKNLMQVLLLLPFYAKMVRYKGVCFDMPCSMGFCAEHAAIAAMITDGESKIKKVIAVYKDGTIIPPCGRCREFICQIHDDNYQCEVMVGENTILTIGDLLPIRWV